VKFYRLYFKLLIVVNCIWNSQLRRIRREQLRGDMEAEHVAHLYYCETHRLSLSKVLFRIFELKELSILPSDHNKELDLK